MWTVRRESLQSELPMGTVIRRNQSTIATANPEVLPLSLGTPSTHPRAVANSTVLLMNINDPHELFRQRLLVESVHHAECHSVQ